MGQHAKTILLVEDDADNSEIIAELLTDAGYVVVPKENGVAALEHLESGARPDLIVLDLMMPEMDGYQFAEQSRARAPAVAEIPLIVLSAVSKVETRAQTIPAKAYLQKPVELTLLLETVKAVIGPP